MGKSISGFSKLSKSGKLRWLVENFFKDPEHAMRELMSYWLQNEDQQKVIDGFSENTISNYYLPYGIAPNFVINGKMYAVPMVTEESSVVAAASSAAKFWANRGGFHAIVIGQKKVGQIHFTWKGDFNKLTSVFEELKIKFLVETQFLTANMNKRGGGILDFELLNFTQLEPNYYQVKINFETCDSMGANFINSVLEECAKVLKHFIAEHPIFNNNERNISIIMSILSNFTPECLVRTWVECPVDALGNFGENMDATAFAEKFSTAIRIAEIDPYRATTHNKGIFNGIDAVVIATANDFRAIEACGHAYAARNGQYSSLSHCSIINNTFKFWMDIPLAVGTVGGLTTLHPIAKRSLELLGNPNAKELMLIIATTGLAQNFAAVRSLVTIGIQKGHMKMHLHNILNHLQANDKEKELVFSHFEDKTVSFTSVRDFLYQIKTDANKNSTIIV